MTANNVKAITFEENQCCGCSACASICNQGAISMVENKRGFLVPIVDYNKCTNCGLCVSTCAFNKTIKEASNIVKSYSLEINNQSALTNSSSGGAFTAFSDVILGKGGYIVGSIMQDDFTVKHVITNEEKQRDKMRGSKYVQSDVSNNFPEIKKLVTSGKPVMFTGTPCQSAALKSFMRKDYDNLYIIDFLCHGVPSNKMFKEHIAYLEKKVGKKIKGYSFRNKLYGWDPNSINAITFDNAQWHSKWIYQIYYYFFTSNFSLRLSCFNCPYKGLNHTSDLTIADFWHIERITGKKNKKGVSLVLSFGPKGDDLIKQARNQCLIQEYTLHQVDYRLSKVSSKPHNNYNDFWQTYLTDGYDKNVSSYFNNSISNCIRFEIKKTAKRLGLI